MLKQTNIYEKKNVSPKTFSFLKHLNLGKV